MPFSPEPLVENQNNFKEMVYGSAVAQLLSALLETERPQVRVLEQDTFILA